MAIVLWTGETATAPDVAEVVQKPNVGHRLAWKPCGTDLLAKTVTPVACGSGVRGDVSGTGPVPSLMAAANEWLAAKRLLVNPFRKSSYQAALALIARCAYCDRCSSAWCFTVRNREVEGGEPGVGDQKVYTDSVLGGGHPPPQTPPLKWGGFPLPPHPPIFLSASGLPI